MRTQQVILALVLAAAPALATRPAVETHRRTLERAEKIGGVSFPAGTDVFQLQNGFVTVVVLGESAKVDGETWTKGTRLDFHDEGRVAVATLGAAQRIHGMALPAGTEVHFGATSRKVETLRSMTTDDPVVNGTRFDRAAPWVEFHPNEKVKSGRLAGDQRIGGITWKGGTAITFHPSGRVESGTVASEQEVSRLRVAAGSALQLFPNGKVHEATLAGVHVLQGYRVDGIVTLYPRGTLDTFTLAEDQRVADQECRKGDHLHLDENGGFLGWSGAPR